MRRRIARCLTSKASLIVSMQLIPKAPKRIGSGTYLPARPGKKSAYDDALRARHIILDPGPHAQPPPRRTLSRIEASPVELSSMMSQAKEAHVQRHWDRVIEITSQVIRNDSKRVGAYLLRAEALRKQNHADRAVLGRPCCGDPPRPTKPAPSRHQGGDFQEAGAIRPRNR